MNQQTTTDIDSQCGNPAADHCARGIASFTHFRSDAMQHIDAAIAAGESNALPKIVKAWMLHGGRDAAAADTISNLVNDAAQCPTVSDRRESELLLALNYARSGNGIESATTLERLLLNSPTDLFTHQLVQEEVFWVGQFGWMRDITERAAPAWKETSAGYGAFLSLRAFANEEAGYLDDAEHFGRLAIEINPADVWGAHAVAHVLYMRGEVKKGISWLENLSANWTHANQMRHHLWWHLCLFLFDLGQHDRILDLLTTEVRNPDSSLIKAAPAAPIDIQNYASLLMRLELYSVDVSSHWDTLASICAVRVHNHGNAFGNLHDMVVLGATGQYGKAEELLESMRDRYHSKSGSEALAYNTVAIPVCQAIVAHYQKNYAQVLSLLGGVRHDLKMIGASHAQRELFFHILVHAADQTGREDLREIFIGDIERMGLCAVPDRAAYKSRSA